MSVQEEWGPWIDHDGKGCPCVGLVVQVERRNGEVVGPYVAYSKRKGYPTPGNNMHDSWYHLPKPRDIIRYRIRKPLAMSILTDILREVERDGGKGRKLLKTYAVHD